MHRLNENGGMVAEVVGEGPAVVLVHGIPGSARVWEGVAGQLASTCRVIMPDLLGFGASHRAERIDELWADRQALALSSLLDSLEVEKAVIVGHDFGGPVVLHLLAAQPERAIGLVLAATNVFSDTPVPFPLSGIYWPFIGDLWERFIFSRASLRMMLRQGAGAGTPRLDTAKYLGDPAQTRAIRTIFSNALHELAERYEPVTEAAKSIACPTTVVWGDEDPFFPLEHGERTAGLLEDADFVVLEGAGHFLPEERPAELAEVIQNVAFRD